MLFVIFQLLSDIQQTYKGLVCCTPKSGQDIWVYPNPARACAADKRRHTWATLSQLYGKPADPHNICKTLGSTTPTCLAELVQRQKLRVKWHSVSYDHFFFFFFVGGALFFVMSVFSPWTIVGMVAAVLAVFCQNEAAWLKKAFFNGFVHG